VKAVRTVEAVEPKRPKKAPMCPSEPSDPSDAKEKNAEKTTKKTRSYSAVRLSVQKSGGLGGDSWTPRISVGRACWYLKCFPAVVGHRSHSAFSDNKISERKRGPFFLFLPVEPVAPKSPSSLSRAGHGERALMSSYCRIEITDRVTWRFYIEQAVWVYKSELLRVRMCGCGRSELFGGCDG
jgi:hypothetical protein